MEKALKQLQSKNKEIKQLYKEYCEKKSDLKEMEADLYIYGEDKVKEAIGKDKVSQKDKEYFIQLRTLKKQAAVDQAYIDYKYACEEYKIMKYEFHAKYHNNIEQ